MVESKDHFNLCLEALTRSKTDTEKLLSLVMVTKYIRPSSLSEDELLSLLDKIGLNFIHRLLVSIDCDEISKDCSPTLLQSIAVNIIQSIIKVKPDHLEAHVYSKFMSLLSRILISAKARNTDEILLVDDIIQCFEYLIESGLKQDKLMQILCQSGVIRAFTLIHCQGNYGFEKVYSLLSKLTSSHCLNGYDPESFHTFLTNVANEFHQNHDQRKFDLCSQLTSYINHNATWLKLDDTRINQWLPQITKGLYDILSSRLSKQLRDPAFFLIAALTSAFKGFNWILITGPKIEYDDQARIKFITIVPKLVCIEICLELRKEETDRDESLLGACLVALEGIIDSVAADENSEGILKGLTPENFLSIHGSMKETISTAIDYIKSVMNNWDESKANKVTFQTVLGCSRIVCLWIVEESDALREQIAGLIPFFIHLLQDEASSPLVGQFIINALYSICSNNDEELKKIIHQHDILSIVKKYQSTSPYKDQIDAICESFHNLN